MFWIPDCSAAIGHTHCYKNIAVQNYFNVIMLSGHVNTLHFILSLITMIFFSCNFSCLQQFL